MTTAPGEGERRAQRGLVPQYKIAAEKIYALLADGRLHAVGIADPEAGTLDDIQVIRCQGAQLILDAYQVKWSAPGGTVTEGAFADLLGELARARRVVVDAADRRARDGETPVDRVTAHLYTSSVASTSALRSAGMRGRRRSLHGFLDEVWWPAQRELVSSLADVDPDWHPFLERLAVEASLTAEALLALAPDLRVETGQQLAEEVLDPHDWQTSDRLDDLTAIQVKLQDLVTARHATYVWLRAAQLVEHLGDEWSARWLPRQEHVFPTRSPNEPLTRTADRLRAALDRYDHGYVVLTGSPGSGKSTLLTNLLRFDDRVAARYYAYVPDNDSITRGEASAFLHDLYLAISGRRGRHVPAPRGNSLDRLRVAFREELKRLGEEARRGNRTEIVLVDGLDHVVRDPAPHHSLLGELPQASEIPEGVVFMIGTRSLGDLPAHVRRAVPGERHVEVEPLTRAAVLRLCEQVELPELGERIFELSAGHPLLAQTYLARAEGLEPARRLAALAEFSPSGGEVWDFYETVWDSLSDDTEVISLLAVVSRLRGTIRLSWLNKTGAVYGEVERLARLEYLFERSGSDRWTFFHSSFREFLRRKTAEMGGGFNEPLHRSHHQALAERCGRSGPDDPERFDRLFHLLEAGRPDTVLAEATPAFFREQLDGLRTREAVRADLELAARALADCHEPLGVVRLALSANELEVRGYQFPLGGDLPKLLVAVGQPELAIAHVGEISEVTPDWDRDVVAMKLVLDLRDQGLDDEARRILELYEPLEWFGARRSGRRTALHAPRSSALKGWARAAAVVRGAGYVQDASSALRSPFGLRESERYDENHLASLRGELLWAAAQELFQRGRIDEVLRLRDTLRSLGDYGERAAVLLDLGLARRRASDAADERESLGRLDVDALPYAGRIQLAERLIVLGDVDAGRLLYSRLSKASPPARDYARLGAKEPSWELFYRYWRLAALLEGPPDVVGAVPKPEQEYLEQVVLAARHVVAFATVEARQQAGEEVSPVEVIAALRLMHAFWATSAGRDDHRRPGPARALVSRRAIVVAQRIGPEAVSAVFDYFKKRWSERPVHLWFDGPEVIDEFAAAGVGEISVRNVLANLEAFLGQDGSPEDWVSLGQAWVRAGDLGAAMRCCRRAVRSTLGPLSDKDLQLGTWTRLLAPLLEGSDGDRLASDFAAALTEMAERRAGGAPDHAAQILLELTMPWNPRRAWDLAKRFLEGKVLNPDDVTAAFLSTTTEHGEHWWTTITELLVAIGAEAPYEALQSAARSDPAAARRWLPALVDRAAIEGRPSARGGWRSAVRDAAMEIGVELAFIEEDEASEQDGFAHSSALERKSEPRARLAVETLLGKLETSASDDHFRIEPGRGLVRRLDELDDAQIARLERCLVGSDAEPELRAALATRAIAAGDLDRAWEQGTRAIAISQAGDWNRSWAGGPMLKLVPALRSIDPARTTAATFSRFAELATSVEYFLGQVGSELADYAEVLGFPSEATAREVLAVAAALLRDIAQLPDPSSISAGAVSRGATPGDVAQAFEELVGWFLRSPHIVAWQAAQRAVFALLAEDAGGTVLESALAGSEDQVLRACAVIETAATDGQSFDSLAPVLERVARSRSLTERVAAIRCLIELGLPLPETATQAARSALPAALRLELPPRGHSRSVVSGVAETVSWFRAEIERLAEAARVDDAALFEHVLFRAERLADGRDAGDDRLSRERSMLGWGFMRPSAQVVRRALGEVAAELVDAGRVDPGMALSVAWLSPLYDTELLRIRPVRRPRDVATFVSPDRRSTLYTVSLTDLAEGAGDRLARSLDDWVVIGERSEVALLDRAGHRESRWSGIILGPPENERDGSSDETRAADLARVDDGGDLVHDLVTSGAEAYRGRAFHGRLPHTQAVVGSRSFPPAASPSGWLGLRPQLARELGLTVEEEEPFAWRLDGEAAVRSVWWRTGYDRWPEWSDEGEVGEGWLVVASPAFIERWRKVERLRQEWVVFTKRLGETGASEEQELRSSGRWEL